MDRRKILENTRRIVVKIGSSSLSNGTQLSREKMKMFVQDVATLVKKQYEVAIVTSGAISAGAGKMNMRRDQMAIPEKQAAASIGQTILMNEYLRLFNDEGITIGQVLLSEEDVVNRGRFLNARNAMLTLLQMGCVPIVNENDTVAINEIRLGDNDTLAAFVAQIVEADLTILLSDIDGFYLDLESGIPLSDVCEINETIWNAAGGTGSTHGTGGMFTKIRAADMIMKSGDSLIIAKAGTDRILERLLDAEKIGTLFVRCEKGLVSRKRFIAFNMEAAGSIVIDKGAQIALVQKKRSLLPAGIVGVDGSFEQGDAVEIVTEEKVKIGRGITNYTSAEILKIKGKKSSEIQTILDGTFYEEAVHRDNMIIIS